MAYAIVVRGREIEPEHVGIHQQPRFESVENDTVADAGSSTATSKGAEQLIGREGRTLNVSALRTTPQTTRQERIRQVRPLPSSAPTLLRDAAGPRTQVPAPTSN